MKIITPVLELFLCCLGYVPEDCNDIVQKDVFDWYGLESEISTIMAAAARNKLDQDDLALLLAIRKAENGRQGLEFGITHWRCRDLIRQRPSRSLDIQAGWCAATIIKNRRRYAAAGRNDDFIGYLADRYCPFSVDPAGHKNWIKNVTYWHDIFSKNGFFNMQGCRDGTDRQSTDADKSR